MVGTTLRNRIHATWEAFFPSSLYFVLFIAACLTITWGNETPSAVRRAVDLASSDDAARFLQLLAAWKLDVAVPVAVVLTVAAAIYLFDRIVFALSDLLPAVQSWMPGRAIYAHPPTVVALWRLCPDVQHPAELEDRARTILNEAPPAEQLLVAGARERASRRVSVAVRARDYAKIGVYLTILTALAVALRGAARPGFHEWASVWIGGFLVAYVWNCSRATLAYIGEAEEDIKLAAHVKGSHRVPFDNLVCDDLHRRLVLAMRAAPRLASFRYRRNWGMWPSRWAALLGYGRARRLGLAPVEPGTRRRPWRQRFRRGRGG